MLKNNQLTEHCRLINAFQPTEAEQEQLATQYGITQEMFGYAFDVDERARIEEGDDSPVTLIVYDVLLTKNLNDEEKDPTGPIAMAINGDHLIMFTNTNNQFVVDDLLANKKHIKYHTEGPLQVILGIMYRLSARYFDAIHAIDKDRQKLQRTLKTETSRAAITKLMGMQTKLVYYLTSLRSNASLVQELTHDKKLAIDDNDRERIDDILVELKQGLEMAQMASEVIEHLSDAYTNVLDNDLNNTMQFLTVISVALAVPTIIFGFFGQNVWLPLARTKWSWLSTILISAFIIFMGFLLFRAYQHFKK